ncbi:MAG TPA: ATP-binding protein [Opitutaceae bacterium]|nr:ATP-binding protein [Opitutaceae bacterium]
MPPREPLVTAGYRRDLASDPPDGPLTLPFKGNQFTFEYAVTDFARRDQLLFQTRLVGLEETWSAPTALSRKEYPFLQEGDYRFEVRSLSPAGLTSAPVGWAFRVLPPWWRTGWAYAGYAVGAGLLLFGADRVRIRAMRRRTEWLEEQVKARTADLEKANAAKTEFIARVNHDIRNPINGVLGLTLTLEQTRLDDEQKRLTGTIRQCAKFLASLVEEVLDFAEIEAGALKIKHEAFSLREAVDASIATVDPLARNAGSPVEFEYDESLPARLGGDTARIQQVLVNFLSNAVKFGAGQPITVSARPLHQVGPNLVVRVGVRDRGPGLPLEEQQQLFRKFSRGKLAEEKKIKGTGLGLAVCRLLAERMGGRVGVESVPGHGAEFFLELPLQMVGEEAAVETSLVAGNARVLVVEDEDYNAISLLAMLKRMGFAAERCADGLTALEQLRRERYDVVFLDWELPGLNGIEVARRFRAEEPPDRRTLIIATTAYASADKRDACRAAGMDEFVAKPLTPDRITIAIRGHAGVLTPSSSILVRDEPGAEPSGIDLSLFSYLADDAGGIEAKVAEFIESCERELAEIDAFSAGGRADDLRRAAHRFLSQCRFIGATRLAGLAVELERQSEDAHGPAVRKLVEALLAEFEAFRNELRSSLDARAAAESGPSRSQSG